jgi:hypothetical protein
MTKMYDKLHLAFVLKRRVTDQLAVSLGASFPLTREIKSATKVGLKIDLNV